MPEKLKSFSWGYILIGVLLSAVGILFISFQEAYGALAIAMGIILALAGIGLLVAAFVKKERDFKFALKIIISVIAIVCGIVTMITQEGAISVIANVFFLLLIIDGAFKLQLSILSRRFSFFGWWIILGLSVAVIVTAFLMSKFTPSEPATLSTLSGILILVDGILNLLAAFWSSAVNEKLTEGVKAEDATKPDDEEADSEESETVEE